MSGHTDPLYSIVGNEIRAKLLRVFACNKGVVYTAKEFAKTLKKRELAVKDILRHLEKDRIITKKKIPAAERKRRGLKELKGYSFNKRYPHQKFLDTVIADSMPSENDVLAKKITRIRGVQCVVTANIFIEKPRQRIDLIVASSESDETEIKRLVQKAEQVIGRELRCVFFNRK